MSMDRVLKLAIGSGKYQPLVVTLSEDFLPIHQNLSDWLLGTLKIFSRFPHPCTLIFPMLTTHEQCAIPVFEGLLPEPHNSAILQLIFYLAHWHGLAKLRMHSDVTLAILDKETTVVGRLLRNFNTNTCPQFKTKELRREAEARQRLQAKKQPKGGQSLSSSAPSRKPRTFNLNTYKIHAMGDYVENIKMYGTTDSYSTEPVSDNPKSGRNRNKLPSAITG